MGRFQKPTIKDVAARAGVSVTTVSEFINGRNRACSADTAHRIREAINTLHYTPSSIVNGLRSRESRAVGACMGFPSSLRGIARNAFVERLWNGITEEADAANYTLVHYPAAVRDDYTNYRTFLDGRVDGLLMVVGHDDPRLAQLADAGMPMVSMTRYLNLPAGCGSAYTNEVQTVDLALSHLWGLGHRRIAHITGPTRPEDRPSNIAQARRDAYIAWMRERGAYDPALLFEGGSWEGHRAPEAIELWDSLPHPPTALFCANDAIAYRAIRAAQAAGWSVPGALSIVGVDNEAAGADFNPPLTSVDIPGERIGQEAMRALLRLMNGAPIEECRVAIPVENLILRGSTTAPLLTKR